MCVCVCVCKTEREREREREKNMCARECMFEKGWEQEGREGEREKDRERAHVCVSERWGGREMMKRTKRE